MRLRRGRFLTGAFNAELDVKDVTWITPSGREKQTEQWRDPFARCLGMLLDGRAQATGIKKAGTDSTLLLIVNAHHDVVPFRLPEVAGGTQWLRLVETEGDGRIEVSTARSGDELPVGGRSLLLFERIPDRRSETVAHRAGRTGREPAVPLADAAEP